MSISIRPSSPTDVDVAVPLMFASGPDAYRYAFSISHKDQAVDFLKVAFIKGDGEFGYLSHYIVEKNGEPVGLVGEWDPANNNSYLVSAFKEIFSFYGWFNTARVIRRGLKFETIVSPPRKGVLCLHNLAVYQSFRGQGVGQKIIEYFCGIAEQKGFNRVGLDVHAQNPAKHLYLREGFKEVQLTKANLKNRYGSVVDHIYMEKKL